VIIGSLLSTDTSGSAKDLILRLCVLVEYSGRFRPVRNLWRLVEGVIQRFNVNLSEKNDKQPQREESASTYINPLSFMKISNLFLNCKTDVRATTS